VVESTHPPMANHQIDTSPFLCDGSRPFRIKDAPTRIEPFCAEKRQTISSRTSGRRSTSCNR